MSPVSSLKLEQALKDRTAAARKAKPAKPRTTKVPAGKRRVKSVASVAEAPAMVPASREVRAEAHRRAAGQVSEKYPPGGTALKPRDTKHWTPALLAVPCARCGAKAGIPCWDARSTRTPHGARRKAAAAARAKPKK
jgi:hypothetical protein